MRGVRLRWFLRCAGWCAFWGAVAAAPAAAQIGPDAERAPAARHPARTATLNAFDELSIGLDAAVVLTHVERGLASLDNTPAAARRLAQAHGDVAAAARHALLAAASRPAPITDGATVIHDAVADLEFVVPAGLTITGADGDRTCASSPTPAGAGIAIRIRAFTPDPSAINPTLPGGPATLPDFLHRRTKRLLDQDGGRLAADITVAARGIVGVASRIEIDDTAPGAAWPMTRFVAAFLRGPRLVEVVADVSGPLHHPERDALTARARQFLADIRVAEAAPAGVPWEREAIVVLEESAAGRQLVLIDHAGGVLATEPAPDVTDLGADVATGVLTLTTTSGTRVRSPETAVDSRPANPATAAADGTTSQPAVAADSDAAARARAFLRFESVDDPGSSAALETGTRTVFVESPGSGPLPRIETLLRYAVPGESTPRMLFRDLRTSTLDRAPHRLRFTAGARAVIWLDPDRGLVLLPREGGLPIVLREGRILAAEPLLRWP